MIQHSETLALATNQRNGASLFVPRMIPARRSLATSRLGSDRIGLRFSVATLATCGEAKSSLREREKQADYSQSDHENLRGGCASPDQIHTANVLLNGEPKGGELFAHHAFYAHHFLMEILDGKNHAGGRQTGDDRISHLVLGSVNLQPGQHGGNLFLVRIPAASSDVRQVK
jgi:hypothetical protein